LHRLFALLAAGSLGLAATGCNFGSTTSATGTDGGGFSVEAGQGFEASTGPDAAQTHDAAPQDAALDTTPDSEAGPPPSAKLSGATATGGSSADFGSVEVGKASAPLSIVVSNGGTAATSALTASLAGTNASSFFIDSDGCTGKTLAPSTTCSVSLHFTPAAAGTLSASLTVDAATGGQVSLPLTGQGVTPGALSITPSSQDFGSATTGTTVPVKTFTVTNTGMSTTAAITMSVTGSAAPDFVISQDTCTGKTLAGSATCTLAVTFGPATAGPLSASLDATAGNNTATSSLSGTGVGPAAFSVMPATFGFVSTAVGTSSAAQTFTVTNTGGEPSGVPQVAVAGANPADFVLSANTCTTALTAGATCTFAVTFTPSTATGESATVNVTGTSTAPAAATLTGTGLTPVTLVIAPATGFTGNFDTVGLGKTASGSMTLTNTGQVAMTVAPSIASANKDFTISSGTPACSTPLGIGATCQFVVTFAPSAPASTESSLLTASAAGAKSGTYTVSGTGATPTLTISPPATWPGFGTVEVGSSATADFTVTNTGPVATDVAPTVTSSNPDFAVSNGAHPCTGVLALNGGTCDFVVTFAPKATVTNDSSTLTASVTPGTAGTYTVSGSGAVPTLSIVVPTGFNGFGYVTVGQSETETYQLTNTGPVTSSVPSFTSTNGDFTVAQPSGTGCTTTLAAGASCYFNVVFKPTSSASPESTVITATPQIGNAGTTTVTGQGGVGLLQGLAAWTATPSDQGITSQQTSFTITNNGHGTTNPLTVTPPAASSAFNLQSDTCAGVSLAPGQPCTIAVNFTPNANNSSVATIATATLTVTDSASDAPSAALSGLVLSPTPWIVFSPSPGNFGTGLTLNTLYTLTFTGTNYSSQQATIASVTPFGGGGSDYVLGAGAGTTCNGATLAGYGQPGGYTCTYVLDLTPKSDNTGFGATASLTAKNSANVSIGPGDPLQGSW